MLLSESIVTVDIAASPCRGCGRDNSSLGIEKTASYLDAIMPERELSELPGERLLIGRQNSWSVNRVPWGMGGIFFMIR